MERGAGADGLVGSDRARAHDRRAAARRGAVRGALPARPRGAPRRGAPGRPRFPDWRTLDASIEHQLAGPLEGILFDVEHNAFWLPEWGARPAALDEATVIAAAAVRAAPALVPVAGHRYLPAEPLEAGNPVFSVVQTDIIYYGHDLASYVEAEWGAGYVASISFDAIRPIRFWSRLEERNR